MLDSGTKALLLQLYPMLGGLAASHLEEILSAAVEINAPVGTVMFDENQPCQGFPLLLSGSVRVIKSSANGRELQLYRVSPGESCILTSSCLLGHSNYHARGVVELDVKLVALPPAAFKILLSQCEPFRNYIFSLFSERLSDLMQLVSAVAFQKLDQRLAALLATKPGTIHLTHQALADELGSVREIVSRLLKSFSDQGWVKLGREQIEVKDITALKNFAEL
jgi:CRP/FNR family transcriptional regulator